MAGIIQGCVESVQAQDYPNIEHIIVDGASTDGTVEILSNIAEPGKWSSEPDKGLFFGWNKGLEQAKGEWIAFLGADDRYERTAVSSYMRAAAEHPDAEYISSRVRWISGKGQEKIIGRPWSWPRFQRYMCTAHVGSVHHRRIFEQYGQYDTSLRIVADYELLLRAGKSLRATFIPDITAKMQGGGNSDRPEALTEAAFVKRRVGGRSAALVAIEWTAANVGHRIRRLFDVT